MNYTWACDKQVIAWGKKAVLHPTSGRPLQMGGYYFRWNKYFATVTPKCKYERDALSVLVILGGSDLLLFV